MYNYAIKTKGKKMKTKYDEIWEFETKMGVWDEYAIVLRNLANWCMAADSEYRTQEQKELLKQLLSKVCAEYVFSFAVFCFKDTLNYDIKDKDEKTTYKINNERINIIELITRGKNLVSEFDKIARNFNDKYTHEILEFTHKFLKQANFYLECNKKNKVFINNDINYNIELTPGYGIKI